MSISSKLVTLSTLTNGLKSKLRQLGLLPMPSGTDTQGLQDCKDAIDGISGTQYIMSLNQTDVVGSGKRYAQVKDDNLVASNIASGVTILGVTGTYSGSTPSEDPVPGQYIYGQSGAPASIYPPSGKVFSRVDPVLDSHATLIPANIKSGVTIMGVTGEYSGYNKLSKNHNAINTNGRWIEFDIELPNGVSFLFLSAIMASTNSQYNVGDVVEAYGEVHVNDNSGVGLVYTAAIADENQILYYGSDYQYDDVEYEINGDAHEPQHSKRLVIHSDMYVDQDHNIPIIYANNKTYRLTVITP